MLIVADDLTGALDTGAALRGQGFSAVVVLDPFRLSSPLAGFDVVAITTETRHDPAPGTAVRRLAASLPSGRPIYKKVDSTLRGAIGLELLALLEGTGLQGALVTPAFPRQGRGLADGHLLIEGARRGPHLPTLLAEQTGMDPAHVSLEHVRGPAGALVAALTEKLSSGSRFTVVDALLDDDLRRIADAVARLESPPLLAGSAGFAAWLPRAWNIRPKSTGGDGDLQATEGPVLFVLGSANRQTRAQIRALERARTALVEIRPDERADDETIEAGIRALREGQDLILTLAQEADLRIDAIPYPRQQRAAASLAATTRRVMDRTTVSALVAGGGDTVYALCVALGIGELVLDGEAAPGLPQSHAFAAGERSIRLVTKAGGFGGVDALLVAREALLHGNRARP